MPINNQASKPPIKKYVLGSVTCNVWENTNTYQDGNTSVSHSFTFEKSYKAQDGSFKSTDNFNKRDLASLLLIVEKVANKSIIVREPKPQQGGYNSGYQQQTGQQQPQNTASPTKAHVNTDLDDVPF